MFEKCKLVVKINVKLHRIYIIIGLNFGQIQICIIYTFGNIFCFITAGVE